MSKKIGVIGSGQVGQVLATGFLKHGYDVMIGSRDPQKLGDWAAANEGGHMGTMAEAASHGEIVILAVSGEGALPSIDAMGKENLSGKTILDATNPIDHSRAPEDGMVPFFTDLNGSLMEQLQDAAPDAHFVKCFNSVGNALMIDPALEGGIRPTMFICGNNDGAKSETTAILNSIGWEAMDMGTAKAARVIEPLCILWCIPGFLRNEWTHAFKILQAN